MEASLILRGVLVVICLETCGLLVDPASCLERSPILSSKVIVFVVSDMGVHKLVELAKIIEWYHWITVVRRVVVRVPEKRLNDNVGSHAASVEQAVGVLGDVAISMLEVADEIHSRVAAKDGRNPPEQEAVETLLALTKDDEHDSVAGELSESRHLKSAHDTTVFAIGPLLEAPASTAVVDCDSHGRVEDSAGTALEGVKDVKELEKVVDATYRNIAKARILQLLSCKGACELGVLVNVVGVSVMLLVHHFLVGAELKAEDASQKETDVVDPLGLEGVSMEEFVLASKGEALELKAVKEVERKEDNELLGGEALATERKDIRSMDSKCRERHDGQIGEETLESFVVGLLHEFDQDAFVEDAITLLALAVLDVSPVFAIAVHLGKAINVGQVSLDGLGLFKKGEVRDSLVGRHCWVRRSVG
jgi:hypothetical protein